MHVSVIVALYSSETWPNRYLVINDRSKRRDLRQAMNNIENGHRLHQRQAPPSYSDAMPIVLQNAPPSYVRKLKLLLIYFDIYFYELYINAKANVI